MNMDSGRTSRAEPAVIRGSSAARTCTPGRIEKEKLTSSEARPKRKKARPATSSSTTSGSIPQPYLALAPKPLSLISRSASQTLAASNLVLPSSFRRPATPSSNVIGTSGGDAGPSTSRNRERERERFANGLLAPPTIRAGGASTPSTVRRDRPDEPGNAIITGGGGRRRVDRVRGLGAGNPSMTSLGHLGRIMEADPPAIDERGGGAQTPAAGAGAGTRRRRRIVRGDGDEASGPGVSRRLTVSSREEGRAMGLARGASMRRLNVWDDVPENDEAPPPFPFPTSSSSRLPPTFDSNSSTQPPPAHHPSTGPIPNSPPPSFEQATGLAPPLSLPPPENAANPTQLEPARSASRASDASRYESAPSSPVLTALESGSEEEGTEEERADRRMWNADLLAGYSLEERVTRESARKSARETAICRSAMEGESSESSTKIEPVEPVPNLNLEGPSETPSLPIQQVVQQISPAPSHPSTADLPAPGDPDSGVLRSITPTPEESILPREATPADPAEVEPITDAELTAKVEQETPSLETDPPATPVAAPTTDAISPMPKDTEDQDPVQSIHVHDDASQERGMGTGSGSPTPTPTPAAIHGRALSPIENPHRSDLTTPVASASPIPAPQRIEAVEVPDLPLPSRLATQQASTHSLPTLVEGQETESPNRTGAATALSPAAEDEAVAPVRKLTRGKAIRRSSSGLIKTPDSPTAAAPLFSAARFDFGKPSSVPAKETPRPFVHRASAPEVHTLSNVSHQVQAGAKPKLGESGSYADLRSRQQRKSEDRGSVLPGGRRLGDPPLPLVSSEGQESNSIGKRPEMIEARIPPHREAALLRRESILANLARPKVPVSLAPQAAPPASRPDLSRSKRASLPSGPLIDFSDFDPDRFSEQSHGSEITGLAATNAELLELLELEAKLPQSSSQAASTAALVEDLRAQMADIQVGGSKAKTPLPPPPPLPPRPVHQASELDYRSASERELQTEREMEVDREQEKEKEEREVATKKKPPPPPPPLRSRQAKGAWTAGQKISIVETATSPITPRPSIRRPTPAEASTRNPPSPPASPSPTETKRGPPPLPTRRPPPPPPRSSMTGTSDGGGSSRSSMFDKASTIGPLPTPPPPQSLWRSPNRPRGPRPRPPPPPPRPRTWARIVSGHGQEKDLPTRPGNERSQSEEVLSHSLAINTDLVARGTRDESGRSASEQNLSAAGPASGRSRNPRSPEYTDLDVFVSRLEGSGREYEGFSHIAQFLGPAKSPAASQSALSTLLPGPITIESRRTTKEGKVKLKLTLLGVRVTKCPICLAQFREGEMGVLLPSCGHLGHEGCARRWFREDDRCFVCRERLKGGEGVV